MVYPPAALWRDCRRAMASYAFLWACRLTPKQDEETILALGEAGKVMLRTHEFPESRTEGARD